MEKAGKLTKAKKARGTIVVTRRDVTFALFVLAGFFIGRVLVFDYLNPAVIAYLAVFLGVSAALYLTALTALFGLVTNVTQVALIEYLSAIAILGMANYFIVQNRIKIENLHKSLVATGAILVSGFISAALDGMNFYSMIICVIEALVTFCLVYIFLTAEKTINNTKKSALLTNEQLISISVLMGMCFVGMSGLELKGIYLRDVLSLSAILTLAYAGGPTIGCSAGLIFSIVMLAGGAGAEYSSAYIGILGVSGILAGIFKDFGKAGSALGMVTGAVIIALYLDRSILTPDYLITLGIAAMVFTLIPKVIMEKIVYSFMADSKAVYEDYSQKFKDLAAERLKDFSDSFKLLSATFSSLSQRKDNISQKEVSRLIDKIAEEMCRSCPKFDSCWKNNFYQTYQSIFVLLAASDKKGYIVQRDIPDSFRQKCTDINGFTEVTNRIFLVHKTDVKWHNKIVESRDLVSQQLMGVSEIMDELSGEIKNRLNFNNKYENIIREELEKQKIGVDSLIVLENKYGRYEVDLTSKSDIDFRTFGKNVLTAISNILDRKMIRDKSYILGKDKGVKIHMVEEQKFNVNCGVAREAKTGGIPSGDNYTWLEMKNGQCLVALSDGMGSGQRANEESVAAIEILEQFMESGFNKELAIKMINSILILKSDEDFFTTLDLMCIDLYSGVGEIVKIGAVETYLLRDGKVKVIRSSGLPVGIVSKLDIEQSEINLKDGDIVLIVSDGITDAGRPNNESGWIIDALLEYKSANPQNIADYILERAKALSGSKIKDDMTALALRIWQKAV